MTTLIAVALLDLDGTITDSRPGIIRSIHHAIRALGHDPKPDEDITWAIGPPLDEVMTRVLGAYGDSRVDEAIDLYRERYGEVGLYENALYPGIIAMMNALAQAGVSLVLATSKRRAFAERILEHFGLARHFRAVYGSEPGGALDQKSDLLAHLLAAEDLTPPLTVMVGDRCHDIIGAHANGLRAIGALWGYGSREELTSADADALAATPSEVPGLIVALK
jgi:phosphoglycolate phosphatase